MANGTNGASEVKPLDHTDYSLANLAGVSMPDNTDSPGAKFLLRVQTDVNDYLTHLDHDIADIGDLAHEIADGAVPIYTYEKWQTFVDLAAWQEDLDDWIGSGTKDMDDLSNIALYIIAERLALLLFEEASEANAEADDTEEEEGS